MATSAEIAEAYADWRGRGNANPRVGKMLRGWDRTVHLMASDTGDTFTVGATAGVLADLVPGAEGPADLVVTATSEDLCDLFWGDLNPSEKYVAGDIVLAGAADDVLRLDALSMVAFLDR
jgi:hypothetical protein